MTKVKFDLVLPAAADRNAKGVIKVFPTGPMIELDGDLGMIDMVDQIKFDGPTVIDMLHTGAGWAWNVIIAPKGGIPWGVTVVVPNTDEVVNFMNLPRVDPLSLDPNANPEPVWWAMAGNTITGITMTPEGDLITTSYVGDTKKIGNARGPKGDKGDTGTRGPQGTPGPQGEPGSPGAASTVPGPKGDKGEKGDKGDKGDTGATGAASTVPGPKGDKGDKGDTGATGPVFTPTRTVISDMWTVKSGVTDWQLVTQRGVLNSSGIIAWDVQIKYVGSSTITATNGDLTNVDVLTLASKYTLTGATPGFASTTGGPALNWALYNGGTLVLVSGSTGSSIANGNTVSVGGFIMTP